MRTAILLVMLSLPFAVTAEEDGFAPFVIPATVSAESEIRLSAPEIKPDSPRLKADGAHFSRAGERVRIWGVNLSFSGNFPERAVAGQVAERLAASGVNSVRMHHMDTSNWPRGLWSKDGKTIEPQALERMDYFIDQLARRGIYVNLNLHVGHAHSTFLGLPEAHTNYDKIVGIFTPELVSAQKDFARQMLTHVNPHRKLRYADDPAIAFVEITNEDSLFMWDGDQKLRSLPEYYEKVLAQQYVAWLKKRYRATDKLRAAWGQGGEALGENLLTDGEFKQAAAKWSIEQHEGCRLSAAKTNYQNKDALKLTIGKKDDTSWHLQFNQRELKLEGGRYYTVTFEAAAERERKSSVGVSMAHEPWGGLGLAQGFDLRPAWRTFRFGFTAKTSDDNARLSFSLGESDAAVYLRDVALRPGGREGLHDDESLETSVKLYAASETSERTLDRMRFLAETEKSYFDAMRNYIKQDLGCQALVTGTIVFGPLGLWAQSDMDFIDAHSYWQHPRFPGRSWDAGNWLIEQKALTDNPEGATLFGLAASRMAGKPFTVTEYNHPMPNDYQAECMPMLAAFGAAQDWDGVWLYSYSHDSDGYDAGYCKSYFDSHANPAKWGFMPAGAAIFRDGAIAPLARGREVGLKGAADALTELAGLHQRHDRTMPNVLEALDNVTWQSMIGERVALQIGPGPAKAAVGDRRSAELAWAQKEGQGLFAARGDGGFVITGRPGAFQAGSGGQLTVTAPAFAAVAVVALDGQPFLRSKKILVTACGRCENTGMKFSADRRTVGREWGRAPIRIEPVEGALVLPPGQWTAHLLGPDGKKLRQAPIAQQGDRSVLTLSADDQTMWRLLTR